MGDAPTAEEVAESRFELEMLERAREAVADRVNDTGEENGGDE
ncbi:hypothetical protein [Halorhabdus tiamatea]|nr:hypothetical protein [Halorhabdus tiamatea]